MAIEPGSVIAKRYRVTRPLGKGGMGEVFAAENTRTGRMVAIKVLRAESKAKQSAIERFRREARAAGSIDSDFVTQVLDVEDDPDHGIVLVFELLEGESLVERLKRTGPIAFPELWGIVEAVWMGLADAHEAGIIHRDLKPSNVFLEQRRAGAMRVKILDFGISKLPKKISTQSLTQVGQSLGTFSFMPPEQIGKAKTVDHRADIYACATLIFQALSGKLPYHAKNVVAMMELKANSEPRTLSDVMHQPVAQGLDAFVARGLSRNPDDRFQTAIDALTGWRRLRPPGALSFAAIASSGTNPPARPGPNGQRRAQDAVDARSTSAAPLGVRTPNPPRWQWHTPRRNAATLGPEPASAKSAAPNASSARAENGYTCWTKHPNATGEWRVEPANTLLHWCGCPLQPAPRQHARTITAGGSVERAHDHRAASRRTGVDVGWLLHRCARPQAHRQRLIDQHQRVSNWCQAEKALAAAPVSLLGLRIGRAHIDIRLIGAGLHP